MLVLAVLFSGAEAARSAEFNLPTYPVLLNHGSTGWLTVTLSQAPTNGVSLTPSGTSLAFHPPTITFGPGETAKSVMVYDVGNAGPGPVPITYAVTGADAASYNVPPAGVINVQGRVYSTYLGNLAQGATSDEKMILISPSPKSGLSMTLSGAGLTFNPPTLVFNPGDQTQFVTITAASNAPLGVRSITYTLSGLDAPHYQQDGTLTTQIVAPPRLTNASPSSGPIAGGTAVTISGSDLVGVRSVTFGGAAAQSFSVNGATSISAVAPPHQAGSVDITVTATYGSAQLLGGYTYVAPAPTLSNVSPNAGPPSGGTSVTITGTDLTGATAVTFGGTAAISFTVNGPGSISAITSPHVPGATDVTITTPGGSVTLAGGFTYASAAPVVGGVSPNTGAASGGSSVSISGINFTGATAVSFGGVNATSFTVNSANAITAVAPAHAPGAVDVSVTTPAGTGTFSGGYTYTSAAPILTGMSPISGPSAGGTSVTITGYSLAGTTAVAFDGVPATTFTVTGPNAITAIAPAHAPGAVTVAITTPGGTATLAGGFTYLAPGPTLSAVSPVAGPTAGGSSVTLTGTNLVGATAVTFGGVAATSFVVNSATSITAITPAHAAGAVEVAVVTPAGSAILPGGYTYQSPNPGLWAVSPGAGPIDGGTSVTITIPGANLTGATAIFFGGVPAISASVLSPTSIIAVAPPHAAGAVDIVIGTPGGPMTLGGSYIYMVPVPTIATLSPTSGPASGGTSVTITGTGLGGVTDVRFGGVSATSITSHGPTAIAVIAPPHAPGPVDVVAFSSTGAAIRPNAYTYDPVSSPAIPTLTSISPSAGPAAGGTGVTLTGANLIGATAVTFGGVAATSFAVTGATAITAVTSPHAAGAVDVVVTTPGGAAVLPAGFRYQTLATDTTITSSKNPSEYNQPVTFTASVTSRSGVPVGTVVFTNAGTPIGSVALMNGRAQLTVSNLAIGNHAIKAAYLGGEGFGPSSSAILIQTVAKPADSVRLRQMQVLATRLAAQNSGAAITSAVDSAIAEAFSGGGQPLILGETGGRIRSGGGHSPDWRVWVDVKTLSMSSRRAIDQMGLVSQPIQPSMISGNQVNALMGLTYRHSPELVTGIFAGYENLRYQSEVLDGRLRGEGWTGGAYLGWRLSQGLTFTATGAYSQLSYNAQAGIVTGAFSGQRWLFSTSLGSRFNLSGLVIEPAAQIYGLWENQPSYTDSLGTRQDPFGFFTARTAAGARMSYPLSVGSGLALTPYLGAYGDYYLNGTRGSATPDQIGQAQDQTAILHGWSARLTGGLSGRLSGGGSFNLGAEYGGLGSPTRSWSLRGQLNVPLSTR